MLRDKTRISLSRRVTTRVVALKMVLLESIDSKLFSLSVQESPKENPTPVLPPLQVVSCTNDKRSYIWSIIILHSQTQTRPLLTVGGSPIDSSRIISLLNCIDLFHGSLVVPTRS